MKQSPIVQPKYTSKAGLSENQLCGLPFHRRIPGSKSDKVGLYLLYNPRQASKDFSITRLTILLLLICVSIPFSVFTFKSGLQYALLTRHSATSTGFVTDTTKKSAGWLVSYQFVDGNGVPHEGLFVDTGGAAISRLGLSQGKGVNVLYFPPIPGIFQLESELPRQEADWYALLMTTVAQIAILTFLIWSYRIHLIQKERDKFY